MNNLKKLFSKKLTRGVMIIIILGCAGGYAYYANFYTSTEGSDEQTLQNATVRQGDLITN